MLDYTVHIGSTPTFLYFDLYLYSAYAAHYVYYVIERLVKVLRELEIAISQLQKHCNFSFSQTSIRVSITVSKHGKRFLFLNYIYVYLSSRPAQSTGRRLAGECFNLDRRLVPYTRDARRTKSFGNGVRRLGTGKH